MNHVTNLATTFARRSFAVIAVAALISGFFVSTAFADPTPTTLTITSPNGGEIWSGTHNITWSSTGGTPGDTVSLVYSTNDFTTQSLIVGSEGLAYDVGTFSWNTTTVPDGTSYKVKVVTTNGLVYDPSNANFSVDNTAPTISSVSIPDAAMNIGDTVTATITVGNDAGVTYTLVSGAIDGFTLGSLVRTSVTTYTATFTVTEGGADVLAGSDIPVASLVLADTASAPNQSAAFNGSVSPAGAADSIDANSPTLSSVTIASNNANPVWAKTGDVVTVSFTSNESIGTPTVTIAGQNAVEAGGPTVWTATYTMQAGDAEGVVPFTIDFADLATNAGVQVTAITSGSNVTYDETLPSIAFTQDVEVGPVTSDTVNLTVTETNGNTATYFYGFSANTVCDGTDTYDVAYSSATPFTLNTEANNTKYICAKAVDNAGNTGYSAASANDLNIDITPPVISSISMPTGVYKIGTTFTVTIDADANGYSKGTIVVNGVTLAGALTANGDTTYSINYTISENDLDVLAAAVPTASVTLKDSVLNENTAFTTVTESGGDVVIDATRPILSSVTITSDNANPVWATTDDVITLSFTGNEALAEGANEPVVTIAGNSAVVAGSGTTWTATYTMQAGDTEGVISFTIDFKDVATNTGVTVTALTSGSSVTYDETAPATPSITSIAGDNLINNAEKAAVHVVGTAEANSTVSVTLTGGASVGPITGSASGAGAFDITLDATALTDGTVTPSVTATDAAGNTSTADTTPTATKDVLAPTVSSITTKDSNTNGTVETATIVFSEPVKDSTFSAGDFSIGGTVGTAVSSGTADDNTLDITHAGVAGTEVKDVTYTVGTATDIAGNPLVAVGSGDVAEADAAGPVPMSAMTTSVTTITVTFSEDIHAGSLSISDFDVDSNTISSLAELTAGVVEITLGTSIGTGDIPLVSVYGDGATIGVKDSINVNWTPDNYDLTPVDGVDPVLTDVSISSNNIKDGTAWAKEGNTVTVAFTSSEQLHTNTAVTIGNESATVTDLGTNNWTATLVMDGDDVEGAVGFSIDFEDIATPAHNVGAQITGVTDLTEILYDRTAPLVDAGTTPRYLNIATTQITQSDSSADDGIIGSGIDTYAWTNETPGVGTITFGTPAALTTTMEADNDGAYTAQLAVEDNAGNSATDTMTLVRDTVSPFVKTYNPTTGKINVPITTGLATVTFNENIGVLDASGATIVKNSDDSSVASELASVMGGDDTSAVLDLPYDTLETGTVYRFNVNPQTVRDTAGNPFILSFANHFTTVADEAAPVVESFTAGSITTTGAVLSATTDEDSTCRYSDVDEIFGSMTLFTTTGTIAHEVTLAGLTPATTYDYYTRCVDLSPAANVMTTSAHVSFTTAPDVDGTAPDAPAITTVNATIDADTYVIAGTSATDGGVRTLNLYNGATLIATLSLPAAQTTWAINVSLTQTSANAFTATATDEADNVSVVSNTVTITEATATGDTEDPATPAISGADETVDADTYNLSGTAGADLPSDSTRTITVYNNGTVVGSLSLPAGETDWSFVSPLSQGTANNFTAYSTDEAGNVSAVSNTRIITEQQSDTTAPNIVSSDPAHLDIDVSVDADIFVAFDEALDPLTVTTTSVQFLDSTDTPVAADVSLANGDATVVITPWSSLDYLADYHISVAGTVADLSGNTVTANPSFATFTTEDVPADGTAPVITNIRTVAPIGSDSVTITWDTDENSDSTVEYGTDSSYGTITTTEDTPVSSDGVTSHSVTISGLSADTVYHFRVISADANSNTATSADNVFQTDIDDSTAVLAVTGIDAVDTFATADDTFTNGWSWTFYITVPTDETEFAMKFADFTSGANTILAASNIRYYSAQSTEADTTGEAVTIAGANTYPGNITLDGDLDAGTAGRQIAVTVEMKVPVGSAGGSYSAQYGVSSDTATP